LEAIYLQLSLVLSPNYIESLPTYAFTHFYYKTHQKSENAKGYLAEQDEIESKAHFKKK